MGTRSLTVIQDHDGEEIVVMYRQFDGYPTGHGQELADFLKGITVVNGIPLGDKRRLANGAGCLAAQIVEHFKSAIENHAGGIYLHKAGTRDCGEDYRYFVLVGTDSITLVCQSYDGAELFRGSPKTFQGETVEA